MNWTDSIYTRGMSKDEITEIYGYTFPKIYSYKVVFKFKSYYDY
jgi:hypothetical protein